MNEVEEPVVQCPWCNSTDMYYSGSPDGPEEIFGSAGSVRCRNCGHIIDWFEAWKQRKHHSTDTQRRVVGGKRIPLDWGRAWAEARASLKK